MRIQAIRPTIGLLVLALLTDTAYALGFVPTETEWLAWPDYCRARYVVSGAGRSSTYATRVNPGEVAAQEARIGDEAWGWLHHYCAGLVYVARSRNAANSRDRDYLLERAEVQFMGQYKRVPRSDPFFGHAATALGRLHRERGDSAKAIQYLRESMEALPDFDAAYTVASLVYRDSGAATKAREVLEKGNDAVNGNSAEIHYFLGLILIELGEIDTAAEHARAAYDLGYPLPGLQTKLARLGHPL